MRPPPREEGRIMNKLIYQVIVKRKLISVILTMTSCVVMMCF